MHGKIPGMLKIETGIDISRIDYACDIVLYSEFDSRESLEAYATHPEHLRGETSLLACVRAGNRSTTFEL